jgi:hypothetical protein
MGFVLRGNKLQKVKHRSIDSLTYMFTYILLCKNCEMGEKQKSLLLRTANKIGGGEQKIGGEMS